MVSVASAHRGTSLAHKGESSVIDCEACGFAHLFPFPDEAELRQFYGHHFFAEHWPQYIVKMEYEREYWLAIYRERYRRLEKLLGRKGRMLDVGSGPGLFLMAGQLEGWHPWGVEPGESAYNHSLERKYAAPEQLQKCFLHEANLSKGSFDAVHLSLSLEHHLNPIDTIRQCRELLIDGGILVVEVPRDFSPIQQAAEKVGKHQQWWVAIPDHINYFTQDTMAKLLERNGLQVVVRTATYPMEFFLLEGEQYLGNEHIGQTCHRRRMNFEMNLLQHMPAFN